MNEASLFGIISVDGFKFALPIGEIKRIESADSAYPDGDIKRIKLDGEVYHVLSILHEQNDNVDRRLLIFLSEKMVVEADDFESRGLSLSFVKPLPSIMVDENSFINSVYHDIESEDLVFIGSRELLQNFLREKYQSAA